MPNYCYNTLSASDEVLKQIVNEKGEIDFNKIVPMPKELEYTLSPSRVETREEKDKSKKLIDKYGSDNWYDWSCENWGTKWNGETYEIHCDGKGFIKFNTAWEYPDAFINSLSQKFPEEELKVEWEEEQGFGEIFTIKNGKKVIHEKWDLPN
ncbi:hypothetical protein N8527_01700 [bacterium]|nr:hypothetical protein [bacterium]